MDEEQVKNTNTIDDGITPSDLDERDPLVIPETEQPRDFSAEIDRNTSDIQSFLQATTPEEQTADDLQASILQSLETLGGEGDRRRQLEEEAGVKRQQQELQSVLNELQALEKERAAIPISIQEEFTGRGATAGGVEPIQASRLRRNAIRSLGAAAVGQTLQGNLSLAQQNIQNALDAEFEPERLKLQVLTQMYEFNKDALERADKKRSEQLEIKLQERERLLNKQEADRGAVYETAMAAAANGAPIGLVTAALKQKNPYATLALVSPYMRDLDAVKQRLFENQITTRQVQLAEAKFAEDQRQFDLQYALNEKKILEELRLDALAASAAGETSGYAQEKTTRIIQSVGELRSAVNDSTVGIASLLSIVPESQARDFKARLDKLKANIAFGELTAMREASKTGGALGQVSERELGLLESSLGALDQGQSPDQFLLELQTIEDSLTRWKDAVVKYGDGNTEGFEYTSSTGNIYSLPF